MRLLWLVSCLLGPMLSDAQPLQKIASGNNVLEKEFKAAVRSYDSGNFSDATIQLERLSSRAPGNFEIRELLGLSYAARSQNEKAVEQLRIAIQLKPDSTAARTNLAIGLIHLGKAGEAEAECRKALQINPYDYDANQTLAELYAQAGRVQEALPLFEEVRRVRPKDYGNRYNLALAYLLTGKLSDAGHLVEELEKEKDSAELHTLRGRIEEQEGKFLEAVTEFSTAAHMEPSEENLFLWGSELLLHRTYVPAIQVFKEATRRYASSPRLWIGLGMAFYSRGEYEESIHSLLKAADLNPEDSRCYLFLSKAYLSSPSQAAEVIHCFQRYAVLEPQNALAQYYYAMSLWKGRRVDSPDIDYKTVEALLQKSIALDGNSAGVHLQLGILYNDEHAYESSFAEYQRALQIDANLADTHFRLGRYYLRIGEKAKAQDELSIFEKLQTQHQAGIEKERAEVKQFVISAGSTSPAQP